eukprot:gene5790-6983_t
MDSHGVAYFGVATHFVSHSWRSSFAATVTALETLLREEGEQVLQEAMLYLDVCVLNYHTGGQKGASLPNAARQAISTTGKTILLAPNGSLRDLPLKSLADVQLTADAKADLLVHLGEHPNPFVFFKSFLRDILRLDTSRTPDASREAEYKHMLATVASTGHDVVSDIVISRLLVWLQYAALKALKKLEGARDAKPVELCLMLENLGVFYRELGNFNYALPYFRRLLIAREQLWGKHHPSTLLALTELMALLRGTSLNIQEARHMTQIIVAQA